MGSITTHRYHHFDSPDSRRIRPENRVYFESEEQAVAAGFQGDAAPKA